MNSRLLFPFLALLLSGAMTLAPVVAEAEAGVRDAWARATPPGARTAALYLTLIGDGEPRVLVSASTSVAERAELHTHRHENGLMRMEQVEAIDVPADGAVELKPHGDHVMLFGLRQALKPGETVDLKLVFDDGASMELSVPVRDARKP